MAGGSKITHYNIWSNHIQVHIAKNSFEKISYSCWFNNYEEGTYGEEVINGVQMGMNVYSYFNMSVLEF